VNGRRLEVIGVMPAGMDVMDNRTEIWLPLGLNPANRQNRGNPLPLLDRPPEGWDHEQAAKTELTALIQNWASGSAPRTMSSRRRQRMRPPSRQAPAAATSSR